MALGPENKIVRQGVVMNGQYDAGTAQVWLTLKIDDGESVTIGVHPATAAKFHCGQKVTFTVTVDAA